MADPTAPWDPPESKPEWKPLPVKELPRKKPEPKPEDEKVEG